MKVISLLDNRLQSFLLSDLLFFISSTLFSLLSNMDYLWQLRSLDIDSEPQSGSHEQQELQVRRPNTGLQADDHRKRVEDALAINRHDLPKYPERHFEKQKASVHHAVVYDRQEILRLDWDGHHDPMNPRNMRKVRKWVTVIVCSMTALLM